MFLLNLSLVEFVALLGVTSTLVITLYLLNRARRKQTVATLRFWVQAMRPESSHQRRRIQQPLSLLLQLLALALLMLALAQPRLGSSESGARDHVLVLDTSSWMAAGTRERTLMDEAKELARAYVNRVPATDRIMLVRADGLAMPATNMTEDREALLKAIDSSQVAAAALDVNQALAFGAEARRMNSRQPGEVVFIGAGRMHAMDSPPTDVKNLRIIPVRHPFDNCGLRHIGLRRSVSDPGLWDVFISVRNYGQKPATVPIVVQFGGAPVAGDRIQLGPDREQEISFHLRTSAAGWLEARLLTRDSLPDDNRAIVEVPPVRQLKVGVYSDDASALRPLLSSNPYVETSFRPTAAPQQGDTDIVVLDGFEPSHLPKAGIVWLKPPQGASVRVRSHVTNAPVVRWRADHELCSGLHANAVQLEAADVLVPEEGDTAIAEVEAGPVILARTKPHRMVLLGYHPGRSDSRFDVMTPLLFANILRWLKPDAFRTWEVHAETVGIVNVQLDDDEVGSSDLKVTDEHGRALPFNIHGGTLRFYSGSPGNVRVQSARGDRVYSLTLPEVGETEWSFPASAATGLPPRWGRPLAHDIWQPLAIAAVLLLGLDWLLYGRARRAAAVAVPAPAPRAFIKRAS